MSQQHTTPKKLLANLAKLFIVLAESDKKVIIATKHSINILFFFLFRILDLLFLCSVK